MARSTALGASVVLSLVFVWSGCSGDVADPAKSPSKVLKIAVSGAGEITLDGSQVSLTKLRGELAKAHGTGATVWYYRANPSGDPPANAVEVIKAVIDSELPVSLSTEPDFSTVVLPDGTVAQRN